MAERIPFAHLLSFVVDNRGRTCPTDDTGTPLIATNCIRNDLLYPAFENIRFVSDETYRTWFRGHPQPGDIIFVCKGTPGRVCLAPDPVNFCIAQDMVAVRADPTKVYPKFLFALLRSQKVQQQISNLHVGTLIPHFKKGDFDKLLLEVPERRAQQQIGDLYFAFSSKIELNRGMSETLEEMVRALFKSWFVDFDPVRAKADGRKPAGMTAEIAKLFPSELVSSELGDIPRGWKVVRLVDVTSKIGSGSTPRGGDSTYIEEGIALIRSQNVYDSDFVWDGLVRITNEEASRMAGVTIEPEDVLLNITGASILRTCVVDPDVLPARVNQHVAIIRAKNGIPARYIHQHLLDSSTKSYLLGMDAGASRQAVTKGHIESVRFILPPSSILNRWEAITKPMFAAIDEYRREARSLVRLRDTLLPKLLSGELRIENPDAFLKDHVP